SPSLARARRLQSSLLPYARFYYRFCSSLPFFFNDTAPTQIYTLSLHDALPIYRRHADTRPPPREHRRRRERPALAGDLRRSEAPDRKSTRLNSSHQIISYAVFCLKKKIDDRLRVIGRRTSTNLN